MKLIHNDFIGIEFDFYNNQFINLVIENSKDFYEFTHQLYLQIEENQELGWVLSKDNKIESISKNVLFINDYFNFDLNNKKINNLINQNILEFFKERDYYKNFALINNEISLLEQEILLNIDLPLICEKEFFYEDLIKLLEFKINENISFIEKIITYIDIFIKLKKIEIVCFVDIFSYLTKDEVSQLIKQLKYMEVSGFFLENSVKLKLDDLKTVIIDNDFCII